MPAFEFVPYVASLLSLPEAEISVQLLPGGCTNVTARATFSHSIQLTQFGQPHPVNSVILKYAPPFVAGYPTQPMSVLRQVNEAEALAIVSEVSAIPAIGALRAKFPKIRIPGLIHCDKDRDVLWITDLGNIPTLSQCLASDVLTAQDIEQVGSTLGGFFAELFTSTRHTSVETLSLSPDPPAEFRSMTASIMRTVLTNVGAPDAELLEERVIKASQDIGEMNPCLGMVDLWPGSILIDRDGTCGVVDWEYFGLTSAGNELGALLAHLHLTHLKTSSSARTLQNTDTFAHSFFQSYASAAPSASPHFKRLVFIAHGRELVTFLDFFADDLDDISRERVLNAGVRSLRAAGDSDQDINFSILEDKDSRDEFLLKSFSTLWGLTKG